LQHHAVVDQPEPCQKHRENRHLKGQSEGQHQLGREGKVLADPDRRRYADRGVLGDEKGVADLEHHRPAEVAAEHKEQARADDKRQRHPPLRLVETGRDKFPDFVKDRRARRKNARDQRNLDLGEKSFAYAGANQLQLALADIAQRQSQPGEKMVGENVRERASHHHRDHGSHQPRAQLAHMLEQRHADLLRRGGRIGGGKLLVGHVARCGLWRLKVGRPAAPGQMP
jgi:hypothetical protein